MGLLVPCGAAPGSVLTAILDRQAVVWAGRDQGKFVYHAGAGLAQEAGTPARVVLN